jgi:hypothetical protein
MTARMTEAEATRFPIIIAEWQRNSREVVRMKWLSPALEVHTDIRIAHRWFNFAV